MKALLIHAVLLFAGAALASPSDEQLVGHAYDRKSGKPLYTERHDLHYVGDVLVDHRVRYVDPAGDVFAEKALHYGRHPAAPDFELRDQRDGYLEGGTAKADEYRLYRRERTAAPIKETRVKLGPELVADAGFDRYVKARLPTLLEQERATFRMAIAGHLTSLQFHIRLRDRASLFGRPAARFRVEPDSLLRLFADPIDITYDRSTGRLLRYVGISNIRDSQGDRHDVRIDFPPARPGNSTGRR